MATQIKTTHKMLYDAGGGRQARGVGIASTVPLERACSTAGVIHKKINHAGSYLLDRLDEYIFVA